MGAVRAVVLDASAYYACLTHAFSNDQEEVMGLCIGDVNETPLGCEVYVSATMSLRRLDKRKDRVEISVEQLSNASTKVEEMFAHQRRKLRIIGWYHSHPKITVWPSHVDTETQAMYQMMDDTFIGLIFSCFNEDKTTFEHSVHVTCFQSVPASPHSNVRYDSLEIPIVINQGVEFVPGSSHALKELPKILVQEECDMYQMTESSKMDFMTNLHNSAVHVQALCKLNSNFLLPLLEVSTRRNRITEKKVEEAEKKNSEIRAKIDELKQKLSELQ